MLPYQKERKSTRLLREAFEERMRTEHPFTAEQQQQIDDLKDLLARVPKLSIADKLKAKEVAKAEICTAKLDKQREQSKEAPLRTLQNLKVPKGIRIPKSCVEKASPSLTSKPLSPLPSSPSRPRPASQDPITSSETPGVSSKPLPSHVWVITQTTFGAHAIVTTLALCTTFTDAVDVLARIADELALQNVFCFSLGPEPTQRTHLDIHTYARSEYEFGIEACVGNRQQVAIDVKVSRKEGAMWQGKMKDGEIFGDGFEEVTLERVRAIMAG